MNKEILRINMDTKLLYIISCFLLIGCGHKDYQTLEIDYSKDRIEIISSDKFVVDSIAVERFGIVYLSKALTKKEKGKTIISMTESDFGYKTYVKKLDQLNCKDKNLVLDIFIRKKGTNVKIPQNNFMRIENIQYLTLKYSPCSKDKIVKEMLRPAW